MGAEGKIRKIAGDGISLKLPSNEQILEVTGDGCNVVVSKNRGTVRIIGDGCRLRIDQNIGNVEYTGDGGQVVLGLESIKDKVKYVGDGGSIRFDGSPNRVPRNKKEAKEASGGVVKDRSRGRTREEVENALNGRKEARTKTRTRTRTRTRTTVTAVEYDEKTVKRWYANPGVVIRTVDSDCFVKIVPNQCKTEIKVGE